MKKPEVLAPAGDFSKVKVALTYGADAVYVGAPRHGLRQGAENLTFEELSRAVSFVRKRKKKLYVALNAMPHNHELESVANTLKILNDIQPHALIISDPGVFSLAKTHTDIPLHISTQASVLNSYHARMWHKEGAKRIILGRELTLAEVKTIASTVPIEIEIFIHGSMCVSYSGKCTISNYTVGRDSNRGGCVYSCRYSYSLQDEKGSSDESYIMSSKDLMGLRRIPDIVQAGLHSLKIEGRMKSALYIAQTSLTYRKALDSFCELFQKGQENQWSSLPFEKNLSALHNRDFGSEFLQKEQWRDSINYEHNSLAQSLQYIGTVKQNKNSQASVLEVRFPFTQNDNLLLLKPNGVEEEVNLQLCKDILGHPIVDVKTHSLVCLPLKCPEGSVCVMKKAV